jgi:hypothetical protein
MLNGGSIIGRFLSESAKSAVSSALDALITPEAMEKRYGDASLSPLLFAVGDGNHSLATAKTIYESLKASIGEEALTHPARFALIEVVNIHDEAMKFEPIYRVAFGVDPDDIINELNKYLNALSQAYGKSNLILVGDGVDTSKIYFGNISNGAIIGGTNNNSQDTTTTESVS